MNKNSQKILAHPDKEEIISKFILGIPVNDIHSWLAAKYSSINESKFVIPVKSLKTFKDSYLDIYQMIKNDEAATRTALANNTENDLLLSLQNNSIYKSKMIELASKEIDIKKMLANMIVAMETRVSQIFDSIQEDPRNINTRNDRILKEWFDTLGANLERFNKIVLGAPDQVVQHNITVQHIDQHIQIFQEAIRETLAEMDIETSLRFMEIFSNKISKLRPPTEKQEKLEDRLSEVRVLNDTINQKLLGN